MVARFLRRAGHRILARRFLTGSGELDLVTRQARTLAVVEVKTGTQGPRHRPADRISEGDVLRLGRVARRLARDLGLDRGRVDAVEVLIRSGSPPTLVHHVDLEGTGGWSRRLHEIELP